VTRHRLVAAVSLAVVGGSVLVIAWPRARSSGEAALALVTLLLAHGSPTIERWLKEHRLLWPLIAATSAAVAYALVGSTLGAGWSPIDDHEIMKFLGAEQRIGILDVPVLLMDTEVGSPGGTLPRYRPSYYTARLVETAMWGNSPFRWYAAQLLMFAASLALGWRFFTRWIGLIPAAVVLLYMLTYDFWADIWSRLGAGEAYCVLGTALYLEGFARLARGIAPARGRIWGVRGSWIMLALGGWLAIGSKENFLVLLIPLWVLAVFLWRQGRLQRTEMITVAVLTAYGGLIASSITVSLIRTGADVYERPVTAASRFRLLISGSERAIEPFAWWHVCVVLIAASVVAAFWDRRPSQWRYHPFIRGVLLMGGFVALYASQFAFYNGEWPNQNTAPRYNFPGVLSRLLLVVTGAVTGFELIRRLRVAGSIVRAMRAGLVAMLLVFTLDAGWASLRQASEAHASATREWTERLEHIVARLRRDPVRPVVVVSHSVGDYEPIFAVPRFLTQQGVVNPLFLLTSVYRTNTPLAVSIAQTLNGISSFGSAGYAPLDTLPSDTVPFAIGLSGPTPPAYEGLGSLWPMRVSSAAGAARKDGG
jgi:hypothetical protein